ncbi:MAG: helix-turn-helix domain-containing protein [Clostridia bacterium]|nr:helix-turn-helix domain-containing protein [Clostridia bacterium]
MTAEDRLRQALLPYGELLSLRRAGDPEDSGLLTAPVPGTDLLVCCPRGEANADALLSLASGMLKGLLQADSAEETAEARWIRRLSGEWTAADETAHPLPPATRCVLVLQMRSGSLPDGLRDMVPMQRQDVLIRFGAGKAVLVKDLVRGEGPAELLDFACALRETFLEEEGQEILIGIGESDVPLRDSFRQAQDALTLGLRYDADRGVWRWQRMVAERLLDDLPPEKAAACTALIFNRKTARLLDEELLNTAEMFLRNSLNLSDTARQLFIHRSTLMYRLDKLQRATGLDLRLFDDAMTFWLLLLLRRRQLESQTRNQFTMEDR